MTRIMDIKEMVYNHKACKWSRYPKLQKFRPVVFHQGTIIVAIDCINQTCIIYSFIMQIFGESPPLCQILLLVLQHSCVQKRHNSQLCAVIIQQTGWGWGREEDSSAPIVYLYNVHIPIMTDLLNQHH